MTVLFPKLFFKKINWFLLSCFLMALCFRIFILLHCRFALSFDEAHYVRLAGSWTQQGFGALLHPYWPPVYPLLIGLVNYLVNHLELSARIINMVSGAFSVLLIYWLTKQLFGKREARLAAVLMAFHPMIAYHNTNALTETLYSFAAIGGIVTGWKALQSHKIWIGLITGLLFGCCYLLRPEGVGFLIVFLGFLCIKVVLKSISFSKGWLIIIFTTVGFLVFASPYVIYLKNVTGRWTLSTKGTMNQQMESAVYFNEGEMKDPFFHLTEDNQCLPYDMALHFGNIRDLVRSDEGQRRMVKISLKHYMMKYMRNIHALLKTSIPETVTILFLILFSLGFFTKSYDTKQWWFVFYLVSYLIFFWFILVPMFHVNVRYLYPLLPLLFVWIGNGSWYLYHWIRSAIEKNMKRRGNQKYWPNRVSTVLVLFVLIFGLLPGLLKVVLATENDASMWAEPIELKEAGLWLKVNTDRPPVLMSLNKAVDYYAGQMDIKKGASFSYDSIERNLEYARNRGVEYIVLSNRYHHWFPNLDEFFRLGNRLQGLQLVYQKTYPNGIEAVIFKLSTAH